MRTIKARIIAAILPQLVLVPALIGQAQPDAVPLKNWPAAPYWLPPLSDRLAAGANTDASSSTRPGVPQAVMTGALVFVLKYPSFYLNCTCCKLTHTTSASLPDASILYRLILEEQSNHQHGRFVCIIFIDH